MHHPQALRQNDDRRMISAQDASSWCSSAPPQGAAQVELGLDKHLLSANRAKDGDFSLAATLAHRLLWILFFDSRSGTSHEQPG